MYVIYTTVAGVDPAVDDPKIMVQKLYWSPKQTWVTSELNAYEFKTIEGASSEIAFINKKKYGTNARYKKLSRQRGKGFSSI